MDIGDFDFDLPDQLVAQYPAATRTASRLLVLDRETGDVEHLTFGAIAAHLRADDVLVVNETRVVPARLQGRKERTGGRVEMLLLRRLADGTWLAMARPLRGLKPGDRVRLEGGATGVEVVAREGDRLRLRLPEPAAAARDDPTGFAALLPLVRQAGRVPLPPYIRRPPEAIDAERYQTVFALRPGSIAAPTAGLHFDPELLDRIRARGTAVVTVVLHVGPGTFEPVRVQDPRQHRVAAEYYRLEADAARCIAGRRAAGGRCVAVGTTTVRTLETCAAGGELRAGSGWTDLVICPPHRFRAVDAVVTNLHLPRSSLLLLVSAFAGREPLLSAYAEAIAMGYRFYSYGDAMLIE